MARKYKQVDVFTKIRFKGNALAVFFDSDDLSTEEMHQIANWTNLAETTFVLKPTNEKADYRVRIFTPETELSFAGHPTIGTCHSLIEAGLIKPKDGQIFQQCEAGVVQISIKDDNISFKLPGVKKIDIEAPIFSDVASALGVSTESITKFGNPVLFAVGPNWLTVQFPDGESVFNLNPDFGEIKRLSKLHGWTGIQTFGEYEDGLLESRTFAPIAGVNEDFGCGSGAGAIGAYIGTQGNTSTKYFNIKQGRRVSRDAGLTVRLDSGEIYVGGSCVT